MKACEVYAKETEDQDLYKVKDEKVSKGSRTFIQGDFYADDWLERAGLGEFGKEGVFELIYDYTVGFCYQCCTVSKLIWTVLLRHEPLDAASMGETNVDASRAESAS